MAEHDQWSDGRDQSDSDWFALRLMLINKTITIGWLSQAVRLRQSYHRMTSLTIEASIHLQAFPTTERPLPKSCETEAKRTMSSMSANDDLSAIPLLLVNAVIVCKHDISDTENNARDSGPTLLRSIGEINSRKIIKQNNNNILFRCLSTLYHRLTIWSTSSSQPNSKGADIWGIDGEQWKGKETKARRAVANREANRDSLHFALTFFVFW